MGVLSLTALIVLLAAFCYGQGEPENGVMQNAIQYLTNLSRVDVPDSTNPCQHEGYKCITCNLSQLCLPHAAGFDLITNATCTKNKEVCDIATGKCVPKVKEDSYCAFGDDATFQCKVEGVFPSPFDCHLYYTCVEASPDKLSSYVHTCPTGTVYDLEEYKCVTSKKCKEDRPFCKEPETKLGVTKNKSIYYVCEKGFPTLYKCLGGDDYEFDVISGTCHKKSSSGKTGNQLTIEEFLNRSNNNVTIGSDNDTWGNEFTSEDNTS